MSSRGPRHRPDGKAASLRLQDQGLDTVEANERLGFKSPTIGIYTSSRNLKALGRRKGGLLSNNPDKVTALEKGWDRGDRARAAKSLPKPIPKTISRPKKKSWATCSRRASCVAPPSRRLS
jgi:hypothetical protein